MGMLGMSADEIAGHREDAMAKVRQLGYQAQQLVKSGLYTGRGDVDPAKAAEMNVIEKGKTELIGTIAQTRAAEQLQRATGADPLSKVSNIGAAYQAAARMTGAADITKELNNGGITISRDGQQQMVKGGDVNRALQDEAKSVTKAFKELADAAKDPTKDLGALREKLEETVANFDKLKDAAGGGGGASTSSRLSALAGGFAAAGMAAQEIGVNQKLREVSNVAGLAGIENQKYDTYRSAAGGNIAAQLQMAQFGAAQGFGKDLAFNQTTANILNTAGSVAQTGAGYFKAVEGGAQKNPLSWAVSGVMGTAGTATNEVQQGVLDMATGAANTAVNATDISRHISTTAAKIQGTQSYLAASTALQHVGAEQLQGFRDMGVGLGVAAQSMGGRGGDFLNQTISGANLDRMADARISPEQMAKMAQFGAQNIGSTFNASQIFAARGLERSGMGSMQENMQRMSTLASAGSNNPQAGLASVLESAVTKGLDSSKALNIVADNTASMVQASAGRAMGFDTTAAASQIATAAINKGDPNQEYAAARAMTVAENLKGVGTDTGMNFAAMSATARISQNTGLSGTQAIIAQGFDDATLKTMRGEKDPKKVMEALRMRGINAKDPADAKRIADALVQDRLVTTFTGGGAGLATGASQYAAQFAQEAMRDPGSVERLIAAQKSGKYGSAAEKQFMNAASEQAGLHHMGVDEYLRGAVGIVSPDADTNTKKKIGAGMKGEGGSEELRTADDMRTQGAKQLAQAAKEATAGFKNAKETFQALGVIAKRIEEMGNKGAEGQFKGAAADSAKTFGESTKTFETGANTIWQAAQIMAKTAGLKETDPSANRELEKLKAPQSKNSTSTRGH
jgi:hypothetical protein